MPTFRQFTYHGQTVTLDAEAVKPRFYDRLCAGRWEPATFEALRAHLDPNTVYVDIGAWVGVLPYWAAQISKSVVAVDPDPACIEVLRRLQALNPGNVRIHHAAWSTEARVRIHPVKGFGSSETTVLGPVDAEGVEVEGIDIAGVLAGVESERLFVKIDIEGAEYLLADELRRLAAYDVKAVRLAVHPALYERSLRGSWLARRLRTLAATYRLGRAVPGFRPGRGVLGAARWYGYLLTRVLLRRRPKGTDLMLHRTASA